MNQPSNTLQHGAELTDDFLAHYGVLGMKWGKRRAARQVSKATMKKARARDKERITKLGEKAKKSNRADTDAMQTLGLISKSTAKSISSAQGRATNSAVKRNLKLSKKVRKFERKSDAAKAANDINSKNQKTGNKNIKKVREAEKRLLSAKTPEARNKIAKEINSLIKDNNSTISSRSKGLSRKQKKYIDRKNTLKENTGIKHGADMAGDFLAHYGGVKSEGGVSHDNNDTLAHYGVPGMKWGVRKSGSSSRKTVRTAKKDAKRHMDAKMFYGKTAGTKRKLLKAEVTQKKKNMPGYEKEFEKALANVDQAKSARKATRTRKRKDAAYRTRVTTKQALGVTGPLTVAAGFAVANNPELRRKISTTGKHLGKKITSKLTHGEELSEDFLVHYGVLGMKWGRRKGSSGSLVKSSKKSKKNPKASTLSDSELRQRINRLQMEKQYKQLTTKDRSAASKFVGEIVRESAKKTVSSYVSDVMKTGVDAGIGAAKKSKSYGKGRKLAGNAKSMIKKRKGS